MLRQRGLGGRVSGMFRDPFPHVKSLYIDIPVMDGVDITVRGATCIMMSTGNLTSHVCIMSECRR